MYYNPVKIVETDSWRNEYTKFKNILGITNPVIITSRGNLNRLKLSHYFHPESIFADVAVNPNFESCNEAINFSCNKYLNGVIAIGGGSVMDTAKTVMASIGTGLIDNSELLEFNDPFEYRCPSIFIPTTHGTGSEMTMWGTVWDKKERKKYSISHPALYPDIALLDANLATSLPLDISIITTLDALSHGFEAIWNNNANPTSTEYAIESICIIIKNIEKLYNEKNTKEIRNILLKASNIAGRAFSNTKTAAAHSISYPLTIEYGMPHGVACSLPLSPLLQINKDKIINELTQIIKKLEMKNISELEERVKQITINLCDYKLSRWGIKKKDLNDLVEKSFLNGRMENNLVHLSKHQVRWILDEIY